MSESAAISLVLADLTGKDSLVPRSGAAERVAFLRWLVFLVANIYPTFTYADIPGRFVEVETARFPFVASVEAYRQRLWRQLEREAGQPWFLGDRFSALDIYLDVMTRWGPKRPWFEAETPKVFAIAQRTRRAAAAERDVGAQPMTSVGIVGGLGVGATVHYYEKITAACKARGVVPDLVIVACRRRLRPRPDPRRQARRARRLSRRASSSGWHGPAPQTAVLPAVTPHICIKELSAASADSPDQHRRCARGGAETPQDRARGALMGSVFTVQGSLWGQLAGVEIVKPQPDEIAFIGQAYQRILDSKTGRSSRRRRAAPHRRQPAAARRRRADPARRHRSRGDVRRGESRLSLPRRGAPAHRRHRRAPRRQSSTSS